MDVSAWVPSSAFTDPETLVAGLNRARVGTANLMINDFADKRSGTPFRIFDRNKIVATAMACRSAGVRVWLTSWIMPHEIFMSGALEQLPGLIQDTGAELLVWDAEEPWTRASGEFDYEVAAERAAMLPVPIGLTGIGAAPSDIRPLAKRCSVWMPQCYATTTSTATPDGVVDYSVRQWRDRYGAAERWCIGLAAYDQDQPPHRTMQPPIDDARRLGVESVCYWTSRAISEPAVCKFVAGLNPSVPSHPGIMATLDLTSLPSGTRLQAVAAVQGLLTAWGVDPGPIDGKPGPRTLAAAQQFQRTRGLAVTGVVDSVTWWELLRP